MVKIVACNIFKKELEYLLDEKRIKDVVFVDQGLHNEPEKMRDKLQELIDKIEEEDDGKYTHIVLLYGLCGNGTLGLKISKLKLVIPKAHDCMTLFLGCRHKYEDILKTYKGTYWYNHAWIDQTPMPSEKYLLNMKNDYIEHYGEDNGEYLYELDFDSLKRYNHGVYIKTQILENKKYQEFVQESCKTFNWDYKEEDGSLELVKNLVNGIFKEDILILEKNQEITLEIIK